jgi:sulfatase maturation enzyme AslB (radical SAM superfamily)
VPHITEYQISIDAGSAEIYERVRLGGKWSVLIENFDWLKPVADQHGAAVWLTMVVQKDNWRDIRNFVDLATHYGWRANITKLVDWSTWKDFDSHDVIGNHDHPDHPAAIDALRTLASLEQPNVSLDFGLSRAIE